MAGSRPDLANERRRAPTTLDGVAADVASNLAPGHAAREAVCRAVLKPENRLRRSADFSATVRRGVRQTRSSVVVHVDVPAAEAVCSEQLDETGPRVGFVVSRSVGNAVTRNAVRRRLRHLMAQMIPDLPERARVVVRARPMAVRRSRTAMANDLAAAVSGATERIEARP